MFWVGQSWPSNVSVITVPRCSSPCLKGALLLPDVRQQSSETSVLVRGAHHPSLHDDGDDLTMKEEDLLLRMRGALLLPETLDEDLRTLHTTDLT